MTNVGHAAKRISRRKKLDQLAGDRNGVFTASAARSLGVNSSTLAYHSSKGTIERLGHGVYRLAHYPASSNEPIIAAAAALGDAAVLSHESALKLYGVSDLSPSRLTFTVPRNRRYKIAPAADVEIHTTSRPFAAGDVVQYDGFRATSLPRSIVDAARTHTAPERIEMAIREGLRRNLLTRRDLNRALHDAPIRVRRFIERALEEPAR